MDRDDQWSEYLWDPEEDGPEERSDEEDKASDHLPWHIIAFADEDAGYLVLNGRQSGAVIQDAPSDAITASGSAVRPPDRDAALDRRKPLFLLSAGQLSAAGGSAVLARLHAEYGRDLYLGAIASLPRIPTKKIDQTFASDVSAVRIADPECFLLDQTSLVLESEDPADYNNDALKAAVINKAAGRRRRAPYLAHSESTDFLAHVLDAQRAAGANLILTPGRSLSVEDVDGSIQHTIQEGEETLSRIDPQERMALNLTLPWEYLVNKSYQDRLLGELLENDQFDTWYVRAQWRGSENNYLQDTNALRFYKELCRLADDEQRTLILPQVGLSGWYLLGHGASGFSTGPSRSDQAFMQYRRTFRNENTRNVPYFFERGILHSVEFPIHLEIARTDRYAPCQCNWCSDLDQTQIYNSTLARWHGVYNVGRLAAESQQSRSNLGRAAAIRRSLRNAANLSSRLDLVDRNSPSHLTTWIDHL